MIYNNAKQFTRAKKSVILIKTHYNARMSCHQYHIFKKIGI